MAGPSMVGIWAVLIRLYDAGEIEGDEATRVAAYMGSMVIPSTFPEFLQQIAGAFEKITGRKYPGRQG